MNSLISKYAILLSMSYLMALIFNKVVFYFDFSDSVPPYSTIIDAILLLLFNLVLNLIMAFIVRRDIKNLAIKTKYVTLATIVYRPLGVFAFLLFLHFQEKSIDN